MSLATPKLKINDLIHRNDHLDGSLDEIASEILRPADEVQATATTGGLTYHIESQAEAYGKEQKHLFKAKGESAARRHDVAAAHAEPKASGAEKLIAFAEDHAKTTLSLLEHATSTLGTYRRRIPGKKRGYVVRLGALLGGDIAAVSGAALMLGELPMLAVAQAIGTGTAAITAGLLGSEIAESRQARKRAKNPDELTDDERRYAHLFRAPDPGEHIVKIVVLGGLGVGAMIAVSVTTLRASTEGMLVGLCYGALAAAVALASFANSYVYADEVADLIDSAESKHHHAATRLKRAHGQRALATRKAHLAAAASLRTEADALGDAAAARARAEAFGVLHRSPAVAGHGRLDNSEAKPRVYTVHGFDASRNGGA